jgi:hypothetical protein
MRSSFDFKSYVLNNPLLQEGEIKEDANESSLSTNDLECLKKINSEINRQDVIQWFNDNDIDYHTMTDIEMYIVYIKNLLS